MGFSDADLSVMDAAGRVISTFSEIGFKAVPPVKYK
jgi:hypothetical protein